MISKVSKTFFIGICVCLLWACKAEFTPILDITQVVSVQETEKYIIDIEKIPGFYVGNYNSEWIEIYSGGDLSYKPAYNKSEINGNWKIENDKLYIEFENHEYDMHSGEYSDDYFYKNINLYPSNKNFFPLRYDGSLNSYDSFTKVEEKGLDKYEVSYKTKNGNSLTLKKDKKCIYRSADGKESWTGMWVLINSNINVYVDNEDGAYFANASKLVEDSTVFFNERMGQDIDWKLGEVGEEWFMELNNK